MTLRKSLSSVIIWSIISAAFIGPGTVTTAASAGSLFQLGLLWTVLFSTGACIILQELSARLTIATGEPMGPALLRKYGPGKGRWLALLLGGPVILGCAAYEAGNILGAVSGLDLLTPASTTVSTVMVTATVMAVLWTNRRQAIGWIMTCLVALMGVAFITLAYGRPFTLTDYAQASVPRIPAGSEWLTLALVGTTIVPYNVFMGSGVSRGQTLQFMRIGLSISVVVGGLITSAILIAGTGVPPFTSFSELAVALRSTLGSFGAWTLGVGLFAAGLSSSITSPYAASIIAATVFGWGKSWQRLVWFGVVLTGFVIGVLGLKPIPVILLVQALNGLVLPLLTAYLILLANDPGIISSSFRPAQYYNLLLLMVFGIILFMGLHSIDKTLMTWIGRKWDGFVWMTLTTVALTVLVGYRVVRLRLSEVKPQSHQTP